MPVLRSVHVRNTNHIPPPVQQGSLGQRKIKNNQHPEFANGHPLNYYSSGMQLKLPERTGRLVFLHPMVDCGGEFIVAKI
jgi:hypothetical protein